MKKNLIILSINLLLSILAVFVFNSWIHKIIHLQNWQGRLALISSVILLLATYFVGKTFYTKGVLNNLKKIFIMAFLVIGTIGLLALGVNDTHTLILGVEGLVLASILFYMLSLAIGTLTAVGIAGIVTILATGIYFGVTMYHLNTSSAILISKISMLLILFLGGTWAEIRYVIHGIRGTNNDQGGFGDSGDGDGDTGDE